MDKDVLFEVTATLEGFLAVLALEHPVAGVHIDMAVQVALLAERLAASCKGALVRLDLVMYSGVIP